MSRPGKLNAEMQNRIVQALEAGNYFDASCAFAGITPATGYNWMARGRKELERRETTSVKAGSKQWESEQPYVEFFDAVTRATAQVEVATIAEIKRAGIGTAARYDADGNLIHAERPPDWHALTWFMEHRYPRKWGKQVQEHSGNSDSPITFKVIYPDDE